MLKILSFAALLLQNSCNITHEGMPGCDTENLLFMYDAPNMDNGFDVFLKKIVKEEPEIKLVIVDTFQLIRGEQFAGNAYACEYAEMNYLKKLAKILDVTIILVHPLDIADFIKSGISPDIPPEVLRKKPKIEVINLKFDKKILEELFIKRMKKYPDALTYDDISKITGRTRKFVYKWVLDGRIKAVALNDRVNIVPKQWLLEYMLTDDFIYNYASCNRLKPILNQAIVKR